MKLCLVYMCFHLAARTCCATESISSDQIPCLGSEDNAPWLEGHGPTVQDVFIQAEPGVTSKYHEVELLQTSIQLHHFDPAGPVVQQHAKPQANPAPFLKQEQKSQADLHQTSGELDLGFGTRFGISDTYELTSQMRSYVALANDSSVKAICETGFFTGESSALWLCTNPYATLYSFDIMFPPDSLLAIKSRFGERFVAFKGDTLQTLTEFAAQDQPPSCDLMIMDGGHYGPTPGSDLRNFAMIASKHLDRKHTLIVDEVFWEDKQISDETGTQTVTLAVLDAWHAGMFFDDHSACYSYEPFSTNVFQLTAAGVREMNSTYPLGGWCELIFSRRYH